MNNQTVSNSIGNTQTQTSTATAQSVADVVARYCISRNEDVVKDFVAVSNFLKKNETVLSSEDLTKLKLEIAHNYLQKVLERNLPLVEVAKVANLNNINRAKELLNELVNSTNEEVVEELWKQFNVLLNGCELVEMVNLLYRKKVALSRLEKRKHIIPKLLQKYGSTQQQEVQTESVYLQESIDRLTHSNADTPIALAVLYLKTGSQLATMLQSDITLEDQKAQERQYFKFYNVYRRMLQELERADAEYNESNPKYCTNEECECRMLQALREVKTNEQCEDVCKRWTDILNYRMDVHRSTGKWCRTQYAKLVEFSNAFDEEAYKDIE